MSQSGALLYRLFYRSRQTPLTAARLDSAVEQIIGVSIPRNRDDDITGRLLVFQDHFIQALEGGVDAVRTTFARISMDPRHSDVHIISQGPATHRLFGEWNMCASSLSPADKAILAVLDGKADFNPRALNAASVQQLLVAVSEIQRRAAATQLSPRTSL